MKKRVNDRFLMVRIDKLTNSIEGTRDGTNYSTVVKKMDTSNSVFLSMQKGWGFDWHTELEIATREVYGLFLDLDSSQIQGLMSMERKVDHIHVHLLESAPHNLGKQKEYLGVPANLMAYACKKSVDSGFEGTLAFYAKSQLIIHYSETLGAKYIGGQLMVIYPTEALYLIQKYKPKLQ